MSERLPEYEITMPTPRCPQCGSSELAIRRSKIDGDGSKLRHYLCRSCRQPFRAWIETTPIDFHKLEVPPGD